MNQENQNIEWKESWRDEYLKWICGFANASGGKIYIGKNDVGTVVGIKDAAKLLEEIPNKVKDILGIIIDVNLLYDDEKQYLELDIEAYPYPISYKGQYHYRSGSTKQELKGAALDRFLLRKTGKRWDSVPVPNVSHKDLATSAFDYFRKKGIQSKHQVSDQVSNQVKQLLMLCKQAKSRNELLDFLGLSNHFYNFQRHIEPLLNNNWLEMTNKESPKNRNQKYILTEKGRKLVD